MTSLAGSDPIKNSTDQAFMADVIDASRETPVIVDFWAPWCGPCKQLSPPLEKAVRGAAGKVKLVKINIDENPAIAGQLGVRSIPAVYAFSGGRPVDGFVGVIPESQIKQFIDRLAGAGGVEAGADAEDIEALLTAGGESFAAGDLSGAAQAYVTALQLDEKNPKSIAGLARVYLSGGDPDKARAILDLAEGEAAKDPAIAAVRTALDLAAEAADAPDSSAQFDKVIQNPDDHEARFDLARAMIADGDLEGAVAQLMTILAKDRAWNDGAAHKQLLKIFEAAGPGSEIAKAGRRKLSSLLFS